jgi:hypothetical protein
MKPFLNDIYDGDKDRRYGTLFIGTLFGFVGAVALGGVIYAIVGRDNFNRYIVPYLPVIAVVLLVPIWISVRRAWKRRHERLQNAALSRDELLKARSKLRNGVKPARPLEISMPDTDLKY